MAAAELVKKKQASTTPELIIFPNPARDYIRIMPAGTFAPKSGTVVITDAIGKTVMETALSGNEPVDVSRLQPGLYHARLMCKGKVFARKFLKQ